jgi:hypothetical protein
MVLTWINACRVRLIETWPSKQLAKRIKVPCSAASASRRRRNHIARGTGGALKASYDFGWQRQLYRPASFGADQYNEGGPA